MSTTPKKIRDDKLWQDVYKLAVHIYARIDDLIANFPDEEWTTASKLRSSANDSLFYVSQAVGSAAVDAKKYELNAARKNLFALQAMYMFATKQKFLQLEPEIIVKLDEILSEVDKRIDDSEKARQKEEEKELEPWLRKYRLWQKMQD